VTPRVSPRRTLLRAADARCCSSRTPIVSMCVDCSTHPTGSARVRRRLLQGADGAPPCRCHGDRTLASDIVARSSTCFGSPDPLPGPTRTKASTPGEFRSDRWSTRWSGRRDSNPRPHAPKANAVDFCRSHRLPRIRLGHLLRHPCLRSALASRVRRWSGSNRATDPRKLIRCASLVPEAGSRLINEGDRVQATGSPSHLGPLTYRGLWESLQKDTPLTLMHNW